MSQEVIRLADLKDFVEIEVLERGTLAGQNKGDLRLGVSVQCGTFAGSSDLVWIAREEWSSFVDGMRRLERDRTGGASLRSMSPDEFELHLQVIDRAGHVTAHGVLSRRQFLHGLGRSTRSRIEYLITIDPGLLREIVQSVEMLGRPVG